MLPAISLGFTILLLLLLSSQLHLWGSSFFFFFCIPSYVSGLHHSSSSSSAIPSYIPGVHHSSSSSAFPAIPVRFTISGQIFAYVAIFNPTIEVVTFRLRGWCVLGVFLLPAFTRLEHLLDPCDGMHVSTD